MTAITHNTNQVNLFALLANKIKSSIGIEIWSLEQHRTYKQLTQLTDRELDDIGIARCDIRDIVNECK